MSRDITEIRAYLRLQNRDQTWAYVEKKKKEQYIRIAVKKLGEEYDDFHEMKPFDQLELIVARAKFLAIKEANSDNEFVPTNPFGQVLDEEGNIDPDAENPNTPARFGDGTKAEIGETRERNVGAGMAKPKTFGRISHEG